MHDYQRDQVIYADADRLYAYLSDIENVQRYFARMRSAELVGEDQVYLHATVEPPGPEEQEIEGHAWFIRDPEAQRIRWGSEGENNYHGRLTVFETGERTSRVVLKVHTESGHDGIEEAIDETLSALENAVHADA